MKPPSIQLPVTEIESLIVTVREQRVILAPDLAAVYGVPTKALNQAIKRNADKFPADFMLTLAEAEDIRRSRSQIYFVERATNLMPPAFSLLQTNIPGLSDTTSFTDTGPPLSGPAYYRVGVQP